MAIPKSPPTPVKYTTSARVQAWFLGRSRDRWKMKYRDLKVVVKRLQNRVNDVTKSREQWRAEARQLRQRLQELEPSAHLHEQALKKDGAVPARTGRP